MADFVLFIVDDDEDDFFIIQEAFARLTNTHRLEHIRNGKQLLDRLSDIENSGLKFPDLILMDINMPKIDGIRALELIKGNGAYSQIPVIIYSTSSSTEQTYKCMDLGAKAVVAKGWNFEKVLEFVHSIDRFLCDPGTAAGFENSGEDETDEIRKFLV